MSAFAGRRILVVEDEPIIAMTVEDALLELGCEVVGPISQLSVALKVAETEALDAAILDLNISGDRSYGVAAELARRSIPFAFATGYGDIEQPAGFADVPTIAKPYGNVQLKETVETLLGCSVQT